MANLAIQKQSAAQPSKSEIAASVATAATDLIRILQSAEEQRRAAIDGEWGDEEYRDIGFLHHVVLIALSSDAWDQLAVAMSPYMVRRFGKIEDVGAIGYALWPSPDPSSSPQFLHCPVPGIGLPPMDPHLCDWDDHPTLFAVQIERVRHNLRWFLAWEGLTLPAEPSGSTLPPPPTTYEEGISQALGIDIVEELRSYYDIPILGWCLAIINAIIEIAYAIFGTATGVETQAIPLAEGEQDSWATVMAATLLTLRGIEAQARAIAQGGPLSTENLWAEKPASRPSPSTTHTRQIVAISLGTAAALALVWAALA